MKRMDSLFREKLKFFKQNHSLKHRKMNFLVVLNLNLFVIPLIWKLVKIVRIKNHRGMPRLPPPFRRAWVTSEKMEKSVYENSIFVGGVKIHTPLVLKGLRSCLIRCFAEVKWNSGSNHSCTSKFTYFCVEYENGK